MAQPTIKHIIAIASGKGGVGKSTIAVQLALALSRKGHAVGLLDADIYGPSIPTLLNTVDQRPVVNGTIISPIKTQGLSVMSIGYLVDTKASLAWRGPMIGKALQQLLNDTDWGKLDYLIVDLPPGTGDIQLTLCQKVPVTGAIIVTTPQDVALVDVRRACEMFNKLNVPMVGVVENMSEHRCTSCGHAEKIFGEGGGQKLAKEYQLELLAQLPLTLNLKPDYFDQAADTVLQWVARQPKNYANIFPKIVVEQTKKE